MLADAITRLVDAIQALPTEAEQVEALNRARDALHRISPFAAEPVDCVLWVPAESVLANDYNPNVVAPPEMALLAISIGSDGYTQPIVTAQEREAYHVVDGFHRHLVGKHDPAVSARIRGYLPVTRINPDRHGRPDRMAATVRHNRARGKHTVMGMSSLVRDLARRNWSDARIARELGMEPDEVLRLKQITGLAEMFATREFSEAWEED